MAYRAISLPTPTRRAAIWQGVGSGFLLFLMLGFIWHSVTFGVDGLVPPLAEDSHLFSEKRPVANVAIFLHMAIGGTITALVPLQVLGSVRRRWPRLHRAMGYLIASGALVVAAGGLSYIALRGTIGGWPMDAGFALSGTLMLIAATQVLRLSRAGDYVRHRRWALRLFVLVIGSWLYRLHYAIWYLTTGGLWSDIPAHTGGFDLVQNFAFYLPYLVILEIWLRLERAR